MNSLPFFSILVALRLSPKKWHNNKTIFTAWLQTKKRYFRKDIIHLLKFLC